MILIFLTVYSNKETVLLFSLVLTVKFNDQGGRLVPVPRRRALL